MSQDRRICMAEGDAELRERLRSAIERNGFVVQAFSSGYPIVTMMDNWPDLYLVDIELPEVNGLEVCKWLKAHDETSRIPVILISGAAYLKIIAASAHADDYIEKPVAEDTLISKISDCLSAVEVQ